MIFHFCLRWLEWLALSLLLLLLQHLLPPHPRPTIPCLLLAMLLLEVVGRPSLLPLRPHSLVPAPHCCTPANLYPGPTALRVAEALSNIICGPGMPKDYALVKVKNIIC